MYAITIPKPGGPEALVWTEVPDPEPGAGEVLIDVAMATQLAADPPALVRHLDRMLLANAMPASLATILLDHMAQLTDGRRRATESIWLVVTSPQFAVQK